MLFPTIVLIAGCVPQPPAPDLPRSFFRSFGGNPNLVTFTAQTPPGGATGQDVVAALRAEAAQNVDPRRSMFRGSAIPLFGVIDCGGDSNCAPGPYARPGEPPRTVWVLLYPACHNTKGDDFGFAIVDAEQGVDGGYMWNHPCRVGS